MSHNGCLLCVTGAVEDGTDYDDLFGKVLNGSESNLIGVYKPLLSAIKDCSCRNITILFKSVIAVNWRTYYERCSLVTRAIAYITRGADNRAVKVISKKEHSYSIQKLLL